MLTKFKIKYFQVKHSYYKGMRKLLLKFLKFLVSKTAMADVKAKRSLRRVNFEKAKEKNE